jgi:hypothetical protein
VFDLPHCLLEIRHGRLKPAQESAHIDEVVGMVYRMMGELLGGHA